MIRQWSRDQRRIDSFTFQVGHPYSVERIFFQFDVGLSIGHVNLHQAFGTGLRSSSTVSNLLGEISGSWTTIAGMSVDAFWYLQQAKERPETAMQLLDEALSKCCSLTSTRDSSRNRRSSSSDFPINKPHVSPLRHTQGLSMFYNNV